MTLRLIGCCICWFVAFLFLVLGIVVVKSGKGKQDTISKLKLRDIEANADSFFVWIIFIVVNSIGAILSAMPWGLIRVLYILIGLGLLVLGVKCIGWFD